MPRHRGALPGRTQHAYKWLLGFTAASSTLAFVTETNAEQGPIHPDVLEHATAVATAKGPEAFTALRNLWRTWDRADPTHVEEAIVAIRENKAQPPPVRAYAGLLEAYARRRRGDLEGAHARVERLGFVSRYMSVGPFNNDGKTGIKEEFARNSNSPNPFLLAAPTKEKNAQFVGAFHPSLRRTAGSTSATFFDHAKTFVVSPRRSYVPNPAPNHPPDH